MEFRYLLSLGSNLGNRHAHLMRGLQLLGCEVNVRRVTRIMETLPLQSPDHDVKEHGAYLNCVVDCEGSYEAQELYDDVICPIEDVVGHDRTQKWQPRALDVDVLFWAHNDDTTFDACTPIRSQEDRGFKVPHMGVWTRPFLLELIESDLHLSRHRLMALMD